MNIRYSLLPYTYTLFHKANAVGGTVLRALAWEFPNDESLKAVETQFMSGPALLVTPVLEPLATTVKGVFPGVAEGTRWYDWYTWEEVQAQPGENKTLDAPLVHQPVHIRGGYIIPTQKAGNTTKTSRQSPWSLIVALDKDGCAEGELYLDDGLSYVQEATKYVEVRIRMPFEAFQRPIILTLPQFKYDDDVLTAKVTGLYNDHLPIANITILGAKSVPTSAQAVLGNTTLDFSKISLSAASGYGNVLLTNLEEATADGVWSADFSLTLSK